MSGRSEQTSLLQAGHCTHRARCLIPRFDGVILSQEWKEALWDKFVTGAQAVACILVPGAIALTRNRSTRSVATVIRKEPDWLLWTQSPDEKLAVIWRSDFRLRVI